MHPFIFNKLRILKTLRPLDWFFALITVSVILFLVASSLNQEKWVTIEFKVSLSPSYFPYNGGGDAPYWLAEKIRPGDYQYDNIGNKNMKILSIKKWGYQNKEMWVTASVKAKYKPKQKKYTYLYQPLEIGRTIDVTINGSNIHGIVSSIQGFSDTRPGRTITISARLIDSSSPYSTYTRGVEPWIADAIKKDAQMKDVSGNTIAKILDVSVAPAQRVVTTDTGQVILSEDPFKKDVFLTIQMNVIQQDGNYMFLEDKPIIIGWSVPIFLEKVVLYPVITGIFE